MLGFYKIRVNSFDESKEAQELFFELGYYWAYANIGKNFHYEEKDIFLFANSNGIIGTGLLKDIDYFNNSEAKEITLPQLREMVSAHRNNVKKSKSAYKQVIKYQSEDGRLFDTEQECINYHNEREIVSLLEDNIYALRHEDGSEVLDLMKQHKELFLEYLQNI